MKDSYDVLGVARDASEVEIRAAFRKVALSCHPDRGGDPGGFRAACAARDELLDPERRRALDARVRARERPRLPAGSPGARLVSFLKLAVTIAEGVRMVQRERERRERDDRRARRERGREE